MTLPELRHVLRQLDTAALPLSGDSHVQLNMHRCDDLAAVKALLLERGEMGRHDLAPRSIGLVYERVTSVYGRPVRVSAFGRPRQPTEAEAERLREAESYVTVEVAP
jgi:hypothetical protein